MGNISSYAVEGAAGTRCKEPLTPTTTGVLSVNWQQLASKAKQAENDMREAAEGAPAASTERNVQDVAKDIIETSQRSRQKPDNRRRKKATVSRTVTSQRSSSKIHNDIEMEF